MVVKAVLQSKLVLNLSVVSVNVLLIDTSSGDHLPYCLLCKWVKYVNPEYLAGNESLGI